jgi:hypothetical protein
MKRPVRQEDGMYYIKGKKYRELFGSREQVMNETAYKTTGELVKSELMKNKRGRIVSTKKFHTAKKQKHLGKYLQRKGSKKFGPRKTAKKSKGGASGCLKNLHN